VILASCSVLGIVLAVSFLIVNIKFRNQRYIKMSSPHLNNLIIIGCMLTYLSVIFLGMDSGLSSITAFPYICTARAWLLMAGFSLAFGAMFSKTWRVHSIFTDLKLNKKVIKDYQLFIVVGVLLGIDIAIMTTWQVADPFYRDTKQLEPFVSFDFFNLKYLTTFPFSLQATSNPRRRHHCPRKRILSIRADEYFRWSNLCLQGNVTYIWRIFGLGNS
jgi:7 transmembrane sweet-taste receptor of 3 GCPR